MLQVADVSLSIHWLCIQWLMSQLPSGSTLALQAVLQVFTMSYLGLRDSEEVG